MRSNDVVTRRAKNLLRLSRHLGLESGADLVLELIFLRWELAQRPGAWSSLIHFLEAGGSPRTIRESELADFLRDRLPGESGSENLYELCQAFDYIDRDSTSSGGLQKELHLLFEEVLAQKAATVSRAGQEFATQEEASRLMARLVAGAKSILDPACGEASVLSMTETHRADRIYGVEVVESVARIAAMRLALAGVEASIKADDWLTSYREDFDVDAVVLEPPFGVRLGRRERQLAEAAGLPAAGNSADVVWMHSTLAALNDTGIAAVLMPISSTFGKLGELNIRTLYARRQLVAVVQLPPGLLRHTGMATCIWLLSAAPRAVESVLMVDTSPEAAKGSEEDQLFSSQFIDEVAKCVEGWRNFTEPPRLPSHIAKVVSREEIHSKNRLDPNAFLDAPPSEEELRPGAPAHLLHQIRLKNFKSFGATETIPLAPLTLIYGKNSAGKSSILQSLLLLKQSLAAKRLVTQGQWSDSGSFATAVHHHDTSKSIDIGVSFGSPSGGTLLPLMASSNLMRKVDLTFSEDEISQEIEHVVGVGFGNYYATFASSGAETGKEGTFELSMESLEVLLTAASRPGVHFPTSKAPITEGNLSVVPLILSKNGEVSVRVGGSGLLPAGELLTAFANPDARQPSTARSYIQRGLALTSSVTEELQYILNGLSYLGPLRQSPQRYYSRSGASGAAEPNVAIRLFDNVSEQKQISQWLKRLGIQYELEVVAVGTAASREIVGDLVAISLTDSRSGIRLSPSDVGFGVSQVLPILVELSARQQTVICIEQPEIHLHPALQAEMADVLVESADPAGRGNQVIVETHSEHLVLRVQRRIREGSLDPQQVAIVYVDQTPSGEATIKRLRLNAQGEFEDEWPNGFFDDRLAELFGGY